MTTKKLLQYAAFCSIIIQNMMPLTGTADRVLPGKGTGSMDKTTLAHLCELSKLDFTEEQQDAVIAQMDDIIALMDKIKEYDVTYDDTQDHSEIPYGALREDAAQPSYDTARLQQNTQPRDDCYVVPKMME